MENKTVTINPDIKVPEGDKCFEYSNEHDKVIFECDSFVGDLSGCAIWPNEHLEPAEDESYTIKCDPCKAECEKAKDVCTECGGSGKVDISEKYPIGSGLGFLLDCPKCQPKGVEDE